MNHCLSERFRKPATLSSTLLEKISDDFNFGQKQCPKIKPPEILNVRNFYSTVQNLKVLSWATPSYIQGQYT